MTLSLALWVLEQEAHFARKYFSWGPKGPPTIRDDPFWVFTGMAAVGVQSGAISSLGYGTVLQTHAYVDDYVWMRTAPQHAIKGFRAGPGVPKGIHPFGWTTSKRSMYRLGAAKMAARFIPYVGWGLLAYDLYTVGKWAHGKITD